MSLLSRNQSSPLRTALSWLVTLLVPVTLVMIAIRSLMFPWFLIFEYQMPGFPSDPFGFSMEDRLHWSGIDLDYLLNDQGISFLGDLRFPDGTAVYNQRELSHMVDAKNALRTALMVGYVSLGLLIILGVWAWFGQWWVQFRHGLGRGGWLTVFFVVGILIFVAFGFGIFFVAFHEVFFPPGTWMFYYSDTLIRLFPERFWRDIFIYVGVLSAGMGLLIGLLTRRRHHPISSEADNSLFQDEQVHI
jgi:integral membrane protein (TIGR01906 family)